MIKMNGSSDVNIINLSCLGHSQICIQKDLFGSIDSLYRKMLKIGILFIIRPCSFIGIDVE
jgi:hypothetical protein